MEELLQMDEVAKILNDIPWHTVLEVFINIVILVILSKIIDRVVNKTTENLLKADRVQLAKMIPLMARLLKIVIIFLAVAAFLQSQGYSVNSFLAGFGITGLAVGFAAKEAISDIFGSFSVITDKVFRIGDYISIGSEEGTVEDINFRSTRLRKLDDTILAIPNRTVASAAITNYSLIRNRMMDETFGVVYGTSNEKLNEAIEILKNIALNDENVLDGFQVFIQTLNSSSIDIRFIAYFKTGNIVEMRKMKTALILKVVEKFREAGIDFAFPSTSIYMENN
ncbi:MAG: mechanosensitive ion channel family protein [Fusobacterium sp.]|nr:mechanosensitive ion channel family protein [Fusobacterium sp.]